VGLILADARDGTIFVVNPVARRIFRGAVFTGQKLAECGRLEISRMDGKSFKAEQFPLAKTVLHGETLEEMRAIYKYADDGQVLLLVSSKPIYADNGQLIGGLMIARDVIPEK
jgi:hypothetical protein